MGLLHKFMPARDEHKSVKVISDLDLLVSQPIGFRYRGRNHIIQPMTTENYIAVVKALHDMEVVAGKRQEEGVHFDQDTIYAAYFRFVSSVCNTITFADIKTAKLPQLHALMALITKHIKGETANDMVETPFDSEAEKKKRK